MDESIYSGGEEIPRPSHHCGAGAGPDDLDSDAVSVAGIIDSEASDVSVVIVGDGPLRSHPSGNMKSASANAVTTLLPVTAIVSDSSGSYAGYPQVASSPPREPSVVPVAAGAGGGKATGLRELQKFHRLLRGQYKWAILLALILGSLGGIGGFRLGVKTYRSSGIIRVMPVVPKVMYAVDEKGTLPMYESYVDAQIAVLKSQRVAELALDDPAWLQVRQDSDRADKDKEIARFAEGLEISRQGELIWVRATSPDSKVAVAAVNATIAAYMGIYRQTETDSAQNRDRALGALQETLKSDWNGMRDQIQALAKTYGTEDLKSLFQYKQAERNKLESAVRDVEMQLALLSHTSVGPSTVPAIEGAEDVAIRFRDPQMVALLDRKSRAQQALDALQQDGYGESHPAAKEAHKQLAFAQQEIDRYVEVFKKYMASNPSARDEQDPRELEVRRQALQVLCDKANDEMLALGKQELRISELKQHAADVREKLDDATRVIEQRVVENQLLGRVVPMGPADRPLEAFRDTRSSTATAGALGGVAIGFGTFLILGRLKGRLDRPDDADGQLGVNSMLGVVPVLPDAPADPEHAALTAHCVHDIRTRLQILVQGQPRQIFGITSPTAGAGKTSLTLALGVSFAAANQRTLLIDCDIVGGGLTRRVDAMARRRLGAILLRQESITVRQLEEGLRLSVGSRRRIGQVLLELGFISSVRLTQAVELQAKETLGLLDALNGDDVLSCVADTGIEGLQVLPLGDANIHDAASLSPIAFRDLLDRATRHFDVIIVDTGPILGSLEVSVVASQTDAVVLAVSKGETKALVEKALSQLSVIGGRVAGLVFNRARDQDVITYSSHGSSSRGARGSAGEATVEHREVPEADRLGPVARAVACWSPAMGAGSRRARTRQKQASSVSPN